MKTPRRALVTGAGGFVGARLCERLAAEGWTVAKLLRRQPDGAFDDNPALVWIDKQNALAERLSAFAPHVIFNLAGFSQIAEARHNPSAAFESNTAFVWRLLSASQKLSDAPVVVQASSAAIYDPNGDGAATESEAPRPIGIYAASKVAAEVVAAGFELPTVVARLANVYGPRDNNQARLIPYLVAQFATGQNAVLREGGARRSYVHIDDAVDALIALARSGTRSDVSGAVFNIAGSRLYANREVAEIAREASGRRDLRIDIESDVASPARPIAIDRIYRQIGWAPRIGLRDGLRSLFNEGVALCA